MGLAEHEFIKYMERFDACPFQLILNGEPHQIGSGNPAFSVVFHKTPAIKDLLSSTSLTLGEAYMNKDLEITGNLYEALNHFLGQMGKFTSDHKKLKKLLFSSLSKQNQKEEVTFHYDLGNSFYKLWLDPTMCYSCGYFTSDSTTLYEAQCQKVDRILKKLSVEEGMSLCDVGCGWGYLLIYAAKKYKVRGTGITLSKEQKSEIERRIAEEHLEDLVTVKLLDYRDLPKLGLTFDRVVSIGMAEHVGRKNYEEYLSSIKSILKPGGLFLLHHISSLKEYPGDAWMKKYIFPGGVVPSLREMISLAGELDFYTLDVESLRRHYSRTLLCWSDNFSRHRTEIAEMFDDTFVRMWELYLNSCAATFMNGIIDLHQTLFSNGINNELPMTRWY